MAIRVKARSGESPEQLQRRFKKLCEREGLTKDIKRKEFFEKPSERRRRAARKSLVRRLKTEGVLPGFEPERRGAGGGGGY
ncbi:MAG: 30S ribosomal protein S21 [Phycisphaerae bacterium]|nr:30S ribosomal protein S21 [Phycisphaerae bacterium]